MPISSTVDSYGNYQGETAWSGSGGGLSTVESWPESQRNLPIPKSNNMRGVPDVAYNADPKRVSQSIALFPVREVLAGR